MGKIGDIAAVMGLGIVGGVLFMFATGRWKFPELGDLFKLPEIKFPELGDLFKFPRYALRIPKVELPPTEKFVRELKEPTVFKAVLYEQARKFAVAPLISPERGIEAGKMFVTMWYEQFASKLFGLPSLEKIPITAPPTPVVRPREIPLVEAIMQKKALPPYDPMRGLQLQMRP